jgi:hypothetical protein
MIIFPIEALFNSKIQDLRLPSDSHLRSRSSKRLVPEMGIVLNKAKWHGTNFITEKRSYYSYLLQQWMARGR